jgi:outer membrane receptor protein involved in Fe transport
VQNLPGVARSQFGLGQFVIRSAPPEETLVALEGHPIASPFHLYGLASAIATDLIERIELLPGNFSARYGRVSGGVVNVTLRAPRRDRVTANVDVDVIDAGAFVSVPLSARAAIAAGARASYISALAGAIFAPGTAGFRQWPAYWDWQLALDADLSAHDSIRLVGSGTSDGFVSELTSPDPNDPSIRGQIRSQTVYHGAQARWRHRLNADATHTLSGALGYQLQDVNLGPSVRYHFEAITGSLRDELDYRLSSRTRLFAGIDATVLSSDDQVIAPPVSTSGLTDPASPTTLVTYRALRTAINPAAYAELELAPIHTVKILAGLRADYFSLARSLTVDPRLNAQWSVLPWWIVRLALGGYSGSPKSYAALPGFGNPLLRPERWVHAQCSSEWQLIPGALEIDLTAFVKNGSSVVVPSDRLVQRDGQRVAERFSNDGIARVFGTELSLRMRPGRLPMFAMVAYTLQRSERASCAACAWTTYTWDQPHILNASVGALLPRGFEVGVRVRVSSGLVEPTVIGALYDADHDVAVTVVDRTITGRLPVFFSMDLRGSWRFRAGPLRGQLILEVLNATNNNNVESRGYSFDRRASQPILGLPILPSLGMRLEY